MMPKSRASVITDWRIRNDADLPEVRPLEDHEYVIAPQKFVILRRILVRDLHLVRLCIGAADEIPFKLESTDGFRRTYRPSGLENEALKKRLLAVGAAAAPHDEIALAPGLEVRMLLHNKSSTTTKLRVALLVQEEIT